MIPDQKYRLIPLKKGLSTIVDNADYEQLNKWRWRAASSHGYSPYVVRNQNRRCIYMARQICGLEPGDKRVVDHINHNTLDNRRSNLRICSHTENCWNSHKYKNNKSGHRGISWHQRDRRWITKIRFNHKTIYLGRFHRLEDAIAAYKAAATTLFGEFAYKEPSPDN